MSKPNRRILLRGRFPATHGPGPEVTHFGYSDKTEDFCGGAGAVPDAKIHDPGAFSELEA